MNVNAKPLNNIWKRHAVGWDDLENCKTEGNVDDPGVQDEDGDGEVGEDAAALSIIPERTLFVWGGNGTFCCIDPSTDVLNSKS